ncbi:hypothetical protein [Curtobacterium flaccumfaciens]|uniref:hypothetical protein n=1 Tax=Curtobacterium flaccumfaciens TaxID=2035 RepID=UPI001BE05A09|nr:hypothetical protein [Curtobacterium flaccumfaciens]MBT1585424.1 hypothetical protein [Curtobacterium flaccumfaciens pv. flaccumfaciens]MCX2798807.1 hypothetical protein [Curtobacterium flaccumfaciens pv. flaccumfaciens]
MPVHETGTGPPVRRRSDGRVQRRAPSGHDSPLTSAEVARTVARHPRNRQIPTARRHTRGTSSDLRTSRRRTADAPGNRPPNGHDSPLISAEVARTVARRNRNRNRNRNRHIPTTRRHTHGTSSDLGTRRRRTADAPGNRPPNGHDSPLTSAEVARTVARRTRNRNRNRNRNRHIPTTRRHTHGTSSDLGASRRRIANTPGNRLPSGRDSPLTSAEVARTVA